MSPRGSRHGNWKGCGDISGHRWSEIQRCASRRGITFDITLQQAWTQFIDQNGRCAITGVEINFKERTASLDRIDSTRGYMLENIQWVHKIVNQMKWSLSDQELLEWCQRVVNYADHRSVSV